jgi:murein DD-endopeptidase MepM/ murein hydrolase activator NlpD
MENENIAAKKKPHRKAFRSESHKNGLVSIMGGSSFSGRKTRPVVSTRAPLSPLQNQSPQDETAAAESEVPRRKSYLKNAFSKIGKGYVRVSSAIKNAARTILVAKKPAFQMPAHSPRRIMARQAREKIQVAVEPSSITPRNKPRFQWTRTGVEFLLTLIKKPVVLVSSLLFLASIAAGASILISANNFPLPAVNAILPDEDSAQKALMAIVSPEPTPNDSTPQAALPPLPLSLKVQSYTVRSSDSLASIAKRFGLRQDTIISMNSLRNASSLRAGLTLRIPNMDGVNRIVRGGESLQGIAKSFGINVAKIADANDLKSASLYAGQSLFIPYARLSSYDLRNFYGDKFVWPARGIISSPFGFRINPFSGLRTFHSAIDIAIPMGTPVRATMDGTVADTGYNSVFGNYIILRHSGGYQSLYGHLEAIGVRRGAAVSQGQVIGHSGNTGESTGPHLHFSIFKNGVAVNPIAYVK